MRYLNFFVLIFLLNFISPFTGAFAEEGITTIEIEITASASSESEAKRKAFDKALHTASQKVLIKHAAKAQRHLVEDYIIKDNLRKFFKKVEIVTFDIKKLDSKSQFIGTFRFHFNLNDIKRWLQDNGLTFIEEMVTNYKIIQVPIFVENGMIYHWFDSKIASALLFNAKKINNFEIALAEPSLELISIELLNKYRMHQLAKNLQAELKYDGYNLIICQIQQGGVYPLECENNLLYNNKKFMETIKLDASELDGGKQLASEINSIFLSGFTETIDEGGDVDKSDGRRDVVLELRYETLSSLLGFQKLLTQNPYIMYYKVGESSLNYAKFSIQLKSDFATFAVWLEENGLEILNISNETAVIVVQFSGL